MAQLVEPHGGRLKVLYLGSEAAAALRREAAAYPSLGSVATPALRLEAPAVRRLLAARGLPRRGRLRAGGRAHAARRRYAVADPGHARRRRAFARELRPGDAIGLRDPEGFLIATLTVESIFEPDRRREAQAVFGTTDETHPGVDHLLNRTHPVYLGGRLQGLARPTEYDFRQLRDEPADLRRKFEQWGWTRVVAFQTRNPMHRAHQELTQRAAQLAEANLLLHPVVGPDQARRRRPLRPGALLRASAQDLSRADHLPQPFAAGHAHGRAAEAVWHAIIRKNHGCTHFIVGRDHAGPGNDRDGRPFYGPYDAQELIRELEPELGVSWCRSRRWCTSRTAGNTCPDEVAAGETVLNLSGTELRRRLREGIEIPAWFTFPPVVEELRRQLPAAPRQGFTVLFTGLSGAGKSPWPTR